MRCSLDWRAINRHEAVYVYILAGHSRQLYVGVTNDLVRRLVQHRRGECEFTAKYRIHRLVFFEMTTNVMAAIAREKQIKSWRRAKKLALITSLNPGWDDLAEEWLAGSTAGADPSSLRSSG
jgi:putative endonuclease